EARDFTILASDVSARVLARAIAGEYGERDLHRGLTERQIARHFRKVGTKWAVSDEVRQLVEFQRLNLICPFRSLGVFDLILCRNALIYFNDATRRQVADQFAEMLTPDGWLLLGAAENLYGITTCFESVRLGETLAYRLIRRPVTRN